MGKPYRRLANSVISISVSLGLFVIALSACSGPQSALHPAGTGAAQTAQLFWWMCAGAAVIWLIVIGMAVYGMVVKPERHSKRFAMAVVSIGGIVFPIVVLAGLLGYGLNLMPALMAPGDGLVVTVSGERWWWRVRYDSPQHEPVISANEIRLPVGERVVA